jgi:hypothetical protein
LFYILLFKSAIDRECGGRRVIDCLGCLGLNIVVTVIMIWFISRTRWGAPCKRPDDVAFADGAGSPSSG